MIAAMQPDMFPTTNTTKARPGKDEPSRSHFIRNQQHEYYHTADRVPATLDS